MVISSRGDHICNNLNVYDVWILNSQWMIQPCAAFVKGYNPVILPFMLNISCLGKCTTDGQIPHPPLPPSTEVNIIWINGYEQENQVIR